VSHSFPPPFLLALELDRDADERAIRRAYAQRLKRIDQATDAQGFQALREAYERALHWARLQTQHNAPLDADESPAQPVETVLGAIPEARAERVSPAAAEPQVAPDALQFGELAFSAFAERAASSFANEAAACEALETALADERLINLEARRLFEWRVASLLLDGWKPGHEFLFGPACTCFNWEQDRRQLVLFGPLGAALDAAIDEKLIFFRQPPHEFDAQRNVIRRLRDDAMPPDDSLAELMPRVSMLVQRYPHWLGVVTSRHNIGRWQRAWMALPHPWQETAERQALSPPPMKPAPALARPRVQWWWIGIALIVLGRWASFVADSPISPSRAPYAAPAQRTATVPATTAWPGSSLISPAQPSFNSQIGVDTGPRTGSLFDNMLVPAASAAAARAAPTSDVRSGSSSFGSSRLNSS